MALRDISWGTELRSLEVSSLLGAFSLAGFAFSDALLLGVPFVGAIKGAGIAIFAGALVGLAVGLINAVLRVAPFWLQLIVWILLGLSGGLLLADSLEVFGKLAGKHANLAAGALVASLGLGAAVGLAGLSQQPDRKRAPRASSLPKAWPWVARAALVLALIGCLLVDEYAYTLTYPTAHVALRWGAVLLLFCLVSQTLHAVTSRRTPPSAVAWGLRAFALAWVLLPILTLTVQERLLNAQLASGKFTGISIDLVRTVSDVDGDGYAMLVGGGDCAPFDPKINPGENEIPGNGIDDNCLLGDASTSRQLKPAPAPPKTESPVSVVLVTIDTLRPDRMSLYGAKRPTTPRLAAWGKSALRFNHAISAGAWTSLSLSAVFRGVYPRRLEWGWVAETNKLRLLLHPDKQLKKGEKVVKYFGLPIPDQHETFPGLLSRRGMRTVAVVDDGHSQFLEEKMNIAAGFDKYILVEKLKRHSRGDRGVTNQGIKQLKRLAKGKKQFLLWTHFYGPHGYPPRNLRPMFGSSKEDTYDHILNITDAHVGRFLAEVDKIAKKRDLVVILTSDHGEKFRNGVRGHGGDLTQSNLHVPLLIRGPGITPGVSDELVSLVDLFPTIMNWTKTPIPGHLEGFDVRYILEKGRPSPALSDTWFIRRKGPSRLDRTAATDMQHRFIRDLYRNSETLFDIKNDPDAKKNLIDSLEKKDLVLAVDRYLEENRKISVRDITAK